MKEAIQNLLNEEEELKIKKKRKILRRNSFEKKNIEHSTQETLESYKDRSNELIINMKSAESDL